MKYERNLKDRKLGHEWDNWDGDIDSHEAFLQEPKRLYLGMVFFTFALILASVTILLWGVHPRLVLLHPLLGDIAVGVVMALSVAALVPYCAVGYVLLSGKPLRLAEMAGPLLYFVFPAMVRVGTWFGVSRDRIGSSLLEVHNEITRCRLRRMSSGRILILAPRCLKADCTRQVRALCTEYGCDFHIASTGADARKAVMDHKPVAIVGIACERDLITGIRDVGYRIPVIAVANKRPLGPCKGAFIDMNELREAIEVFKDRFDFDSLPEQAASGTRRP